MTEKILLVDDDPNILNAFRRHLRKKFDVHFADGGAVAIETLDSDGPFALIVSDMQMPDVNGLDLLCHVRVEYPDTVRVMLTGNADQKTAVDAVNHGDIFRFLTKPCSIEELSGTLTAGLEQHRLIVAERQLLSETLNGAIELLNDVLGMTNPTAFGRANRLRALVKRLSEAMPQSSRWQLEIAAGLSQIGWVTIPDEIVEKQVAGQPLTGDELAMIQKVPQLSSQFIRRIPRLEPISHIINLQPMLASNPDPPEADPELVRGARLLDLILTYDHMAERFTREDAIDAVRQLDRFSGDDELIENLEVATFDHVCEADSVMIYELEDGMVLDQDVLTRSGVLIVRRGQYVTESMIARLKNYDSNQGIVQPIRVRV